MPKQVKTYSTFVKGLITEASALTFPENASLDEDNFVLNRDGSRQRRLGMDYEDNYSLISSAYTSTTNLDQSAISVHYWDNVNNDPSLSFVVIQIGAYLHIFDNTKPDISSNILEYRLITLTDTREVLESAQINGELVLSQGGTDTYSHITPLRLSYDGTSFTYTPIEIQVRDLWGVDDSVSLTHMTNPFTNQEAYYNLHNQGWATQIEAYVGWDTYYEQWVNGSHGDAGTSQRPSNSHQTFLGKDASDNFRRSISKKNPLGEVSAPKGSNIINAFYRGAERSAATVSKSMQSSTLDWTSVTVSLEVEQGYLRNVASYAGRVFYSGIMSAVVNGDIRSPSYTGYVFYSQLADTPDKLGKCYQDADPTSEHITDIIDTDGGYVVIPEASNIVKLVTIVDALLVFAENGVWEIRGSDGGFKPTDHQVRKVTSVGTTSLQSIVQAEGTVAYWTKGGIYTIQPDPATGYLSAQNITETTIQTLYTDIAGVARDRAIGVYDTASKKIQWLYNDTDSYDGVTRFNRYNRELVFDTVLGAFYPNTVDSSDNYIAGFVQTPDYVTADSVDLVTVAGSTVTVSSIDVTITTSVRSRGVSALKYITISPVTSTTNNLTFSHYKRDDFLDWYTTDSIGIDFSSFLITGHELMGDSSRDKQATYLTMHFNRTETGFTDAGSGNLTALNPSSCLVQSRWDFSDHSNSGKFGTQFQAYRLRREYIPTGVGDPFNYGQSVITTKSKLRGRGKALSLKIESSQGKDMYLLGWSIPFTGEAEV